MSPDCLPTSLPLPSHACFPSSHQVKVILLQAQPAPLSFHPQASLPYTPWGFTSPSKASSLFHSENPLGTELPLTLALSDSHWL